MHSSRSAAKDVPLGRLAVLMAMSDAQLAREIRECERYIRYHEDCGGDSLRGRVAADAIRQSLSFALAVQRDRRPS